MITDHPQKVYTRLRELRIDPYALILLSVATRFLICLVAIWMGIQIAVHGPNDGVAVLAALACGGVIYGLLSPAREKATTSDKIYYTRWGPFFWRGYGDTSFDKWHGCHKKNREG